MGHKNLRKHDNFYLEIDCPVAVDKKTELKYQSSPEEY
jgi:hypothetical protein